MHSKMHPVNRALRARQIRRKAIILTERDPNHVSLSNC